MLNQAPVKAEAHSRGLKGRKRVSSTVEIGVSSDSVVRIIEWGHSVMFVTTHQFILPLGIYYLVLGEVLRSV